MNELAVHAEPKSLRSVLSDRGGLDRRRTIPTGFDVVDRVLGGGIRTHDLTILGGNPGIGKTIAALQMTRHAALHGETAVYVCYEHDERALFLRLLLMELGGVAEMSVQEAREARSVLRQVSNGSRDLEQALNESGALDEAYRRVVEYSDRVWLVRGSGVFTGLTEIREIVAAHPAALVVIDYLQKVPVDRDGLGEAERITIVSQGLKELAMDANVSLVAIAAADRAGLDAPRLRLRHLRGSSAMAYEADAVIMMNDKHAIVARTHLTYDLPTAEGYKNFVVFTIEKNREGASHVDLEFGKDFEFYRFHHNGRHVNERLYDERIDPQ